MCFSFFKLEKIIFIFSLRFFTIHWFACLITTVLLQFNFLILNTIYFDLISISLLLFYITPSRKSSYWIVRVLQHLGFILFIGSLLALSRYIRPKIFGPSDDAHVYEILQEKLGLTEVKSFDAMIYLKGGCNLPFSFLTITGKSNEPLVLDF